MHAPEEHYRLKALSFFIWVLEALLDRLAKQDFQKKYEDFQTNLPIFCLFRNSDKRLKQTEGHPQH